MKHNISDAEWKVRQQLAACYRLFVRFGWTDLIFTHLSARVPGHPDQYLINPYGLLFEEITASNLLKVDFAGNVIAGDHPYNEAGHAIHHAVLSARDDVHAVLHSHTRAGIAVSCTADGLLPLSQQSGEILDLVSYHPYDYAVDNAAECERLGNDLADKWLMIMNNHGLLSVGRTIPEAFYLLYTLENACKVQVDVMAMTDQPLQPNQAALDALREFGAVPEDAPAYYVDMSWQALLRQLNRDDDSYLQ